MDLAVEWPAVVWNDAAVVEDYGRRLQQLREAKGLSRRAAALQIGIDQETLRNAENSVRHPRFETRYALAQFYGVDPTTLQPVSHEPRSVALLQPTSSVDSVSSTHTESDTLHGEGHDMRSRDDAERAQHLLMGLPPELRARAVDLIYRLTHQATAEQLGLAGKVRHPKEGTG